MSLWFLLLFNLVLAFAIGVLWVRMQRPPHEDPRLSRGLQLLQSKISVLEDLCDRSDRQAGQLRAILDLKSEEVHAQVEKADSKMQMVEATLREAKALVQIFQDKVPHKEMVERQNTVKYVKAAKLANSGVAVENIAQQVDLPLGEIQLIWRLNRDRLQFSETELPDWVKQSADFSASSPSQTS